MPRQQADAIAAAAKVGVGQMIYTAIPRAGDPADTGRFVDYRRATGRAVQESGLPFTILRLNMRPEILPLTGIVAPGARRSTQLCILTLQCNALKT
jgi:NAD(P)H dehydrogenase (quinone)